MARRRSARTAIWVDFPLPSVPSNVMNKPLIVVSLEECDSVPSTKSGPVPGGRMPPLHGRRDACRYTRELPSDYFKVEAAALMGTTGGLTEEFWAGAGVTAAGGGVDGIAAER